MERNIFRLSLLLIVLLSVLTGLSQQNQPLPSITKAIILSSRINVRIVLESSGPLPGIKSAYSSSLPATLTVELGKAQTPQAPAVPADEPQLLKDIKFQITGDGRSSLLLSLKEQVPYRLLSEAKRTVIELDKIQRSSGDYLIAPETQQELQQSQRKNFPIGPVNISEKADRVDVIVSLGQKGITNIFALENPLRLVVDIFDAVYDEATQTLPVGKFGLEQIKIGQFRSGSPYFITRLVFDLKEPKYYALASGPSDLTISFLKDQSTASSQPAPEIRPASNPTNPALKSAVQPPTEPPAKTDVKPAAADLTPKTPVEKNIESPDSLAKYASANAASDQAKKEEKKPESRPAEKRQEKLADDQAKEDKSRAKVIYNAEEMYSGEVLSPRFKDADLRDVVLWLGERVGLNVIFDPEVKGVVTCSFEDVPWDQFLDIILKNNKLGKTLEGNVLRVAPMNVLAEEEKALQSLRDAKEQSGPMLTKTITLSYSKARDVLDLLKNKKSQRGEMVIDDRTNTVIITDTKEKIDVIEKLITVLDTPTPQVSIEARIVEATSTFAKNLGIQWGYRGNADPFYGNQTSLQFPNKILLDGSQIPQGMVTKGIGGPLGGYAVNLPAPAFNTVFGFSFANILDTFRLDLALTALEQSGNGQIISSPKVVTQNNKEADIIQGRQIPVQTQANFTVTTQYINAALELKATPQITAEGTIIMTLDIQNNAADFGNLVNGIPPITTQSAKTTVTVPDGGTTVIGGIYRIEESINQEKVPFLHKIPILGALFKNFARTKQNRELLIFITPRIVK
jgi:type IV pilus assembly protein PilQ